MKPLTSTKLKEYRCFSGLLDDVRDAIAKKLIPVEATEGTQIIREGAPADSFYIICSGEVDIIKSTKWGQAAKIRTLKSGDGFGEMALLTHSSRDTSVIARTRVKLYKILKKDFEQIMQSDAEFTRLMINSFRENHKYNMLKTLQPFALLEPQRMKMLMDRLKERIYLAGENIISEGEDGDRYFVIKSGCVSVKQNRGINDSKQVAVLKDGEGFGEEALIRGKSRNSTVQALDDTTVYILERDDFDEILRNSFIDWDFPEDILEDKRERNVFIDTRITPEYKKEHIKGAINIPIEVMREQYEDLDPADEYLTYCTSDSRGLTAAFLMKSMGFKVKAIRGGLSAWDGPVAHGSNNTQIGVNGE